MHETNQKELEKNPSKRGFFFWRIHVACANVEAK